MHVLTINAGSTSLKIVSVDNGRATARYADLNEARDGPVPDAVAHRVVHGGRRTGAVLITDTVVDELRDLCELAPLHQPPALDVMADARSQWSAVPHVACFDTAFHTTIPEPARTYAIPARFRDTVRVYGFHGLSDAWAIRRVHELAPDAARVVVAHLGGGQSLCAAFRGRSVMSTMGFTPLDGLVMATRSGALDPGAVLWLTRHARDVERVLELESGLVGLCGSSDMREVHARMESGDADASRAFAVWLHRMAVALGGCIAVLGGLDALVFTGGIGEHDPIVRRSVVDAFGWLGVAIDEHDDGTRCDDRDVSASGSSARVLVVRSREDLELAREAEGVLAGRARV